MNSPSHFAIVFDPASGKSISNYVVRGFFTPRELPQALARMLLTAEFALFAGIPIALLVAADFIPRFFPGHGAVLFSLCLTLIAVAWLFAGLLRISLYGPSSGIGCYAVEPDGTTAKLVGALRLRLERRSRKLWIAGLLVEPAWRGAGIGTALVLAAFRLAQTQAAQGPVSVSVFAPSHPASRAIIARQLGGLQSILVSIPPSEALNLTIARLELSLQNSASIFEWRLSDSEIKLF